MNFRRFFLSHFLDSQIRVFFARQKLEYRFPENAVEIHEIH